MKWRTLQPTISVQVTGVSHILGSVQMVSHKLDVCASRERKLLQDQVQLSIGAKVQLLVGIGIAQGSGKIPYTCNYLIVD